MTNPWINHVKQYQDKHKCSYKEALSKSKSTYKKGQSGGNIIGDVLRGTVGGIRKGFEFVPGGNVVMKAVNPTLDKGMRDVKAWESGKSKFQVAEEKRIAAYNKKKKSKKGKK